MVSTDSTVLGFKASAPNSSVDTNISVADIFEFVKENNDKFEADSDNPTAFTPKHINKDLLNADGTPKVVYHGTAGNFNIFQSESNTYWFSESYDYAESMMEERGGGEVKAVYLNMRNPYYAKLPLGKFSDPVYEASI